MLKKCVSLVLLVFILLLSICIAKDSNPPKIIATNPQNGDLSVDSSLTEISVTFNEPMMDKSWSWCYESKEKFPQTTGQPYYTKDKTKNILPVKLEAGKEYIIWLNTSKIKNFKDESGNPVKPYKLTFKTK